MESMPTAATPARRATPVALWIRLLLVASGLTLMLGADWLPRRTLQLHPAQERAVTLYSDGDWGGASEVSWHNESRFHWRCDLRPSNSYPVCGVAINLMPDRTAWRDLSPYDTMHVKLRYEGPASRLRVYLRNFNPAYAEPSNPESFKYSSVTLRTSDLGHQATALRLNEFAVASWWLEERSVPREYSHPEIDRVVSLGVDFPKSEPFGRHEVEIESITVSGPRLHAAQRETLATALLGMLLAWELGLWLWSRRNR